MPEGSYKFMPVRPSVRPSVSPCVRPSETAVSQNPFISFLIILKKFVIIFCWIQVKMEGHMVSCLSGQISYLGKFCLSSYGPKWAQNGPKKVKLFVFLLFFRILLQIFAGFDLE